MRKTIILTLMVLLLCVAPALLPAATPNNQTGVSGVQVVSPVLKQQMDKPMDVMDGNGLNRQYGQGKATTDGTKPDPWKEMLTELMNKVADYAVPLLLTLLFGWLGKKLGFDIPDALKTALEAFIFKVLAQIKAQYGSRNFSNEDMQRLAEEQIEQMLPNNLMKYLNKKFGSVEGAIEYYYPRWVGMKAGSK